MWTEKKDNIPRNGTHVSCPRKSLLDQIGWKGLWAVGWHSTPLALRAIALPYTLIVYRRLLAASDSQEYLLALHSDKYQSSLLFRALRPRFRRIRRILESFAIEGEHVAIPVEIPEADDLSADLLVISAVAIRYTGTSGGLTRCHCRSTMAVVLRDSSKRSMSGASP